MIRVFLAGLGYAVASGFILAFALLVATPVDAKGLHPRCNIDWPCAVITSQANNGKGFSTVSASSVITPKQARRIARGQRLEQAMPFGTAITDPTPGSAARFIRGRLVCARNVNAFLAARGIRGTGSAYAKSFLPWGRASGPVPGAVAVFNRRGGGHVAIVDSVRPDGTVIYLNPSSRRQAWQVGPYNRRPIAFRVAG